MFKNTNSTPSLTNDKSSFLKNTEEARLKRQIDKKKLESAIIIQSFYRGYLTRKQQTDLFINELETAFISSSSSSSSNHQFSSIQIFNLIKKYFQLDRLTTTYSNKNEKTNLIFINMLKYLLNQIQTNTEFNKSYVSLIISAKNYQNFISQSNKIVDKCIQKLVNDLSYTSKEKIKYFEIILAFLICLSNYKYWKCFQQQQQQQLEQLLKETTKSYLTKYRLLYGLFNKVLNQNLQSHCLLLNKTSVTSILCLSIQILKSLNYQSSILLLFCSNILTIPAIVNVYNTTPNLKTELIDCDLSCRLYALFSDSSINDFLADKDLLQSISFLGNLCYLSDQFDSNFQFNLDNFIIISNRILDFSNNNPTKLSENAAPKTETITWNPMFGYLKIKTSEGLIELLDQLRFLWSHKFIHLLFNDSIKMNGPSSTLTPVQQSNSSSSNFKTIIKNMFDKTILMNMNSNRNTNDLLALLNHQSNSTVYRICSFYRKILSLISEPRIEILSALSYEQEFLFGLWRFFSLFLNNSNISIKDLCNFIEKKHPIFDVLFVLSSLLLYLLTIFDSNEIYSEQSILTKNDFKKLASFLNYFVYELIMRDLTETNWFNTFYQLLCVLYEKFRNEYEEEFWNLKDIKIKTFMNDLEKNNKKNLKILEKISWGKCILTFIFIIFSRNKVKSRALFNFLTIIL
jgi:ubiquitin-protein ligase E3 B